MTGHAFTTAELNQLEACVLAWPVWRARFAASRQLMIEFIRSHAGEITAGPGEVLAAGDMWALVTVQGTAIAGTGLCGTCAADWRAIPRVVDLARAGGDWDGRPLIVCTGNDALTCGVCGWAGPYH